MIYIIHGDDQVSSQNHLHSIKKELIKNKVKIINLKAEDLATHTLNKIIYSDNLFAEPQALVISGLHSLPASNKKKELTSFVANLPTSENRHNLEENLATGTIQIILWEKKSLTKPNLKIFQSAKIKEFKLKKHVFDWLDELGRDHKKCLYHLRKALKAEDEYLCFILLIQRIRNLLYIKNQGVLKNSPFMAQKISTQSKYLSADDLYKMYNSLYLFDYKMKTGKNNINTRQILELISSGISTIN